MFAIYFTNRELGNLRVARPHIEDRELLVSEWIGLSQF